MSSLIDPLYLPKCGETDKQGKQKQSRMMRCGDECAVDDIGGSHPDQLDDRIVLFRLYKPDYLKGKNNYKFRTMLLFLPQGGVFYCQRERRGGNVGVLKSLVALNVSWLCLRRVIGADSSVSFSFGEGGYVKRFYSERKSSWIHESNTVSAWRISTGRTSDFWQNRIMYRALQCCDCDGPMLAPDVYSGQETVCWPAACLAAEYNHCLASANSARKDGRHYAPCCHHYRLSETSWTIEPTRTAHSFDLMVDVAAVGQCLDRQSIVMIIDDDKERESGWYLPELDDDTHLIGALKLIIIHNQVLRKRSLHGTARAKGATSERCTQLGPMLIWMGWPLSPIGQMRGSLSICCKTWWCPCHEWGGDAFGRYTL